MIVVSAAMQAPVVAVGIGIGQHAVFGRQPGRGLCNRTTKKRNQAAKQKRPEPGRRHDMSLCLFARAPATIQEAIVSCKWRPYRAAGMLSRCGDVEEK